MRRVKALDFKRINAAALAAGGRVLVKWLPGGERKGGEYVAHNPTRDDKHPGSFSINVKSGAWSDFATGDKGGDIVSLVAYLDGISQSDAAERLAQFLKLDAGTDPHKSKRPTAASWRAISPIPEDAPAPPAAHPKHGKPSVQWVYRNASGKPMCYVCRFDPRGDGERKQFAPLTYCEGPRGRREWRWQALPDPRPLYNLEQIAARAGGPVIVCEGEKAADAAVALFPDRIATTMLNGAQSPHKTDWRALAGREVWLWPDNDEAGAKCMRVVAELVRKAGAASVRALRLAAFEKRAAHDTEGRATLQAGVRLPEKWDAADALAGGWTAEHIALLREAGELFEAADTPRMPDAPMAGCFELTGDGVYHCGIGKDGAPLVARKICGPVRILARIRNHDNAAWGIELELRDRDGTVKQWNASDELLCGDHVELTRALAHHGVFVATWQGAARRIAEYLNTFDTSERARSVDRTGWHGRAFVLPGRVLGNPPERLVYQAPPSSSNPYKSQGTLSDWRQGIAAKCVGNSRLVFAVSCAFAPVLLHLVSMEGGGFHYRGVSSIGKSTALRVAASVWGGPDYMQPLRATDNGMEARAAQHSHTLLVGDEIGQADAGTIGETIYMLANGYGKSRMSRNIASRRPPEWTIIFLTSGEVGLVDIMAQVNRKPRAGQEVRLLDIPADAGAGMGIIEELHDAASSAELSRSLSEIAAKRFGTAGPAFVERTAERFDEVAEIVREARRKFIAQHVPEKASEQVGRAAARFALVGIAGELASMFEITGWSKGEALHAAGKCFKAWLDARGGIGSREDAALLEQMRLFFQQHGEARFIEWERACDDHAPRTQIAAGFRRLEKNTAGEGEPGGELYRYYVYLDVFRSEIVKGHDYRRAERLAIERGWIEPDSEGRPTRVERLPGRKPMRVYVFTPELWSDET